MNKRKQLLGGLGRRSMACLLALVLVLGLVPATGLRAGAISVDEAVQKVVDWGFMRGDISGNMRPDDPITRAEFVTIINRAFGYHVMGEDPFTDVTASDWYAQDVSIAYTENYITGTSDTTFSPNGQLTREQAVVILARNMRLQAYPGEDTSFSDSRDLHEWSRGLVEQAVRYNIVNGYPDGTFRPAKAITRGEAATLLVNAIGNPVQEAGSHTLGGVYGNVTITASGVTLRDTVVAGNLYITDGVDLGSVLLENVRVLGQIVICGGGVSQDGNESIVLRNVDAQELIIDTQRGQEVSLRVDGDGTIASTTVRSNGFLRDNTGDGQGLLKITLDGGEKAKLSLAGNIKQVINITPNSTLNLVSGTAASITIDEAATGSTLNIAAGALADEVNLDVATTVTGEGDIGKLTVNSSGSTVTMLPDEIIVRPGDTVTIGGEEMDSNAAAEASSDPRLMGGYPNVSDLAPTSALAKFSGNKAGTVYWAVTPITSGSVGAGDLINPPSYNNDIVKSGTTTLTGSGVVASAKLDKLTSGGSYYLSAVFVDAREDQSPVKVISFSTPDDTVPNFADGYPYLSRITNISAQVTVMPTKTCQLYYALLPKGASAPDEDDFKAGSGAIPGNLGYGSIPVTKNREYPFDVNNQPLEELKSYDLYLWLSDLEGGKSSAVKKLSFTTVDRTPPKFNVEATVNNIQPTSVGLYANLNEDGTLYWAIVAEGETYPKPLAGTDPDSTVDLSSDNAKLQVVSGMNALKNGKVTMTANKDITFTISGLEKEKSYDLYYVAQDKAGNYSDTVKKITIHTLDQSAPTVTQEFTRYNANDPTHPLPDTDIRIVFSESVMDTESNKTYAQLYQAVQDAGTDTDKKVAQEAMATVLRTNILLYQDIDGVVSKVIDRSALPDNEQATADWTIDYRNAEITLEEGKMVVTFPTEVDPISSALRLKSGATYYFVVENIADTSSAQNPLQRTTLDRFTTVFAQVNLSSAGNSDTKIDENIIDAYWRLSPISTTNVDESIKWDMLIWSDRSVSFKLWKRELGSDGKPQTEWILQEKKGGGETSISPMPDLGTYGAASYTYDVLGKEEDRWFENLSNLKEGCVYEYALSFTAVDGTPVDNRNEWNGTVNLNVNVVAGSLTDLHNLASRIEKSWGDAEKNGITNIGQPETLTVRVPFQDSEPPEFYQGFPDFAPGDSVVEMSLLLSRAGTVYYVLAPLGQIPTMWRRPDGSLQNIAVTKTDETTGEISYPYYEELVPEGTEPQNDALPVVSTPSPDQVVSGSNLASGNPKVKYGTVTVAGAVQYVTVTGLEPLTNYVAYFVTRGESPQSRSEVYCYRFKTGDVTTPIIELAESSPSVGFKTSNGEDANLNYALFAGNQLPTIYTDQMKNHVPSEKQDAFYQALVKLGVAEDVEKAKAADYTVMDALEQSATDGKSSSLFDQYADENTRTTVRESIDRTSGSGGPVASGLIEDLSGTYQYKDFTDSMNPENASNYYCLGVAQNVLGGEYTFKAVYPVFIPKTMPPQLTVTNGVPSEIYPGSGEYTGTVTFTFDEILYWLPASGETADLVPVYNDWSSDLVNSDKDKRYAAFYDRISGSVKDGRVSPAYTDKNPSNTFALKYNNVKVGDTITIFGNGFISGARGNSRSAPITVQFVETVTGPNNTIKTYGWKVIS